MANTFNISAYAGGVVYPPNLQQNMAAIQSAGWTSIIVSLFHVDTAGNINMNGAGNPIITNGAYNGPAEWPGQLAQLKTGGTITTLLASFGGWDDVFQNVQDIYDNNNNSFNGTQLQANTIAFRKAFPAFDLIDMDVEYPDGEPANAQACIIAFCQMWIAAKFSVTFCPYGNQGLWVNCLAAIEKTNPGAVKWWNLQCYAGGGGNDPDNWASAITAVLPSFNTNNYIMASDWTRFYNSQDEAWEGDCPTAMQSMLSGFKGEKSVGGGFIWNIDQIYGYAAETKIHPDPDPCNQQAMADYVNAIKNGLG